MLVSTTSLLLYEQLKLNQAIKQSSEQSQWHENNSSCYRAALITASIGNNDRSIPLIVIDIKIS